jgi:tetratricopeptide (TPR) repeat protein
MNDSEDVDLPLDPESAQLEQLSQNFLGALHKKESGKLDEAEDDLRGLLSIEPRLAEPRMELARILLDTERLSEAEDHAREALNHLEASGPWTEDVPRNVIFGLCHALLAEVLRRRADDDDVIFGDAEEFRALVREAQQHFEKANEYDPSDEYASYHAFFLGLPGQNHKVDLGDGLTGDDLDAEPEA